MADDRYDWLDKDTAEHLLRGDPVSARRGDGARELEQLLEAAAAVGAKAPQAAPLPGEEAAVTAFRQALGDGSGARSRGRAAAGPPAVRTAHSTGVAERTRVARPFRRGLVVALAACAIGGVAVAAGTGVLPGPFRGSEDPEPAATVSSGETPGPLDTREPSGAQTQGTTAQTPDPTHSGESTGPGRSPTPGSSHGASRKPGRGEPGGGDGDADDKPRDGGKGEPGSADKKKLLLSLCQAYESGKRGQLDRETVRQLERKAGGPEKVHAFCRAYLARYQLGGGSGDNDGFGGGPSDSGQTGGSSGGDEDDDEHPSQPPATTPAPGASAPAPAPPAPATTPGDATPSTTPTS
ncbi:hypothetical protein ACWD6P_13685 [Streptomyces sp. NPDC002446]